MKNIALGFGGSVKSLKTLKKILQEMGAVKKKLTVERREAIDEFAEEIDFSRELGRTPGYRETEKFLKHVPNPFQREK